MTNKNRCRCGTALESKPLRQKVEPTDKSAGTFKFQGVRVKVVGRQLVCKNHGVQKTLYGGRV